MKKRKNTKVALVKSDTRPIQTVYYFNRQVVKINRAGRASNAVPRCVDHMQWNHYEATHVEVYDTTNGILHAVIRRSVLGNLTVVFERKLKEGM